jgi:voltage-gated potassium channel
MKKKASIFTREVNFKLLLTGLIILMLTGPVLQEYTSLDNPELLEIIFGGSIMLFVASLAGNLRVFRLGLFLALIALVCALLGALLDQVIFRYLMQGASLAFCLSAVRYSSREVFLAGAVDLNKVVGSVCIYLLLVVSWAILYDFLELLTPGSFTGLGPEVGVSRFDEFVYFSLVTITTLGYGDTSPTNLVAGFFAGMEALVGVFYIAILVASLVGDFMSRNNIRENQ